MGFQIAETHRHSGSLVQFRTATTGEIAALSAYFARFTPEDRQQRFHGSPPPTRAQLARTLASGFAVLARLPSGLIVGEALCVPASGGWEIELSVAAEWRRRGLARQLVEMIVPAARKHRAGRVHARCLTGSSGDALFSGLGWQRSSADGDPAERYALQ